MTMFNGLETRSELNGLLDELYGRSEGKSKAYQAFGVLEQTGAEGRISTLGAVVERG